MAKTIAVVGFGPANATAVAEKFGANGFSVAIIGRSKDRLAAGVTELKARGIDAQAFAADASDPASIRAAIQDIRAKLGPVAVIHWNAYGGTEAGDLIATDPATLDGIFDVAVFGLIAAVREALPDLKNAGDGAVLITNGGFGDLAPEVDQYATTLGAAGVALANAAKHKLAGLLSVRLKGEGVYVGEVMIYGTIKGTATDSANAIDPAQVADAFWKLYTARGEMHARVNPPANA